MRIGVVTISDRVAAGAMEDRGGTAVAGSMIQAFPNAEITSTVVPDERDEISILLARWADEDSLDAIITTGGTGLGPRDVTPEATLDVVHARVPGIEESIRAAGVAALPAAMLSRGVAGIRGKTLIVNLPGSPKGAREGAQVLVSVLAHAIDLLHGRTRHDRHATEEA